MNRFEELLTALINGEDIGDWVPLSRLEEYLVRCCKREKADDITPLTRTEVLLKQLATTIAEGGDSPIPIEVSTEEEMTALLETGEVGSIYKYIGTTGTYENGSLYIIEENYYLTFSSPETFTLGVNNTTKNWDGTLEYSTDTNTWNEWDGTTTLSSGEDGNLYMRGTGNTIIVGNGVDSNWVLTGSNISCLGNIENLLDYQTVVRGEHPPMSDFCFAALFAGNTNLITVPELPATTLAYGCYGRMFHGCTGLTTAPELPATTLADYCYYGMFLECTGLTTASKLPATTLAEQCYSGMFAGCTGITTAPELPATTLADYCYLSMFQLCTSLTTAPKLPATTLADYCYSGMFYGCTSLITAPKLPATSLAKECYMGMFYGCTSLITAPKLPATTLADSCYNSMFIDCTSLTTLPELPATTLTGYCYMQMFSGCTNIKLSTTQTDEYQNAYRIPSSGTGITEGKYSLLYMFLGTGGTFTGDGSINTTYYTSNEVV